MPEIMDEGGQKVDESLVQELQGIQQSNQTPSVPIASPQGQATPAKVYAGFLSRGAAMIIDSIILNVAANIVLAALSYTGVGNGKAFQYTITVFPFVISLLYYALMESMKGQTVGKMALGIKVVRYDGGLMSFGQAALRYVAKILSGLPIGLGFLWMIWDKERRTWHDIIVKSHVIKVR